MARWLGIDYGERRVGVAQSDESGSMAFPLRTITVRGPKHALEELVAVVREREAVGIVIGLPLNMDGSSGEMVEKVKAFVVKLREASGVPVELWDERLTTAGVESAMIGADLSRARRGKLRDQLAAQQILQTYLDAHDTGTGGLDAGY